MKDPIIGIIGGKGQMGKLFADFFKEREIKVIISDKKTKLNNKDVASKADIVIVSVPIDQTVKVINSIDKYIRKESALMDFTGVKEKAVDAMLKANCEVLGMHPMFGSSNPIPGQTVIFCPTKKSGKWAKWMEKFLKENDVHIEKMTPKEHDKMMSVCQTMIHFADIAFSEGLKKTNYKVEQLLKFSSAASKLKILLSARLIAQDPYLYASMPIENPYSIDTLKKYLQAINELIKIIEKKDKKAFQKYFLGNRKFLNKYCTQGYKDTSFLIDKYLEKQNQQKDKKNTQRLSNNALAVLGPENTFTDIAATYYLKENNLLYPKYFAESIDEVFELVTSGKVKQGIIPIENKLHGSVFETLDGLFNQKVKIVKEINIPIHHCLICLRHSDLKSIKKINSHPQAIAQCKNFIKERYPRAEINTFASTASAIEKILNTNDLSMAAIGSEQAAQNPKLKIIKKNIEDYPNSTLFIIIEKGERKTFKRHAHLHNKTSIAFHFHKDKEGSLFEVIEIIKQNKINMTKIESRPTKAEFGEYIFFIDFEGGAAEPRIEKALKQISKKVAKLKVLGSY